MIERVGKTGNELKTRQRRERERERERDKIERVGKQEMN